MARQQIQPDLLRVTRPSKYMRRDYDRFADSILSAVPVGRGSIGKVEVDCRLLFSKSQWGHMRENFGSESYPAGILYLDLVFRQPQDCKLKSATVAVTLGKNDDKLGSLTPSASMTEYYGPAQLRGPNQTMKSRRQKHFTPYLEVAGYGAGGVGISTEESRKITDRWGFSGHLRSDPDRHVYNRLEWDLDECFLEERPSHSNIFHTAFAIGHNTKEFDMTVEVKGKLAGKRQQAKHYMKMKFGSNKPSPQETVAVKFQWSKGYSASTWLDSRARGLPLAMQQENLASTPLEMPEPQPASFHTVEESKTTTAVSRSLHHENVAGRPVETINSNNETLSPAARLQANERPNLLEFTDAFPRLTPSNRKNMILAAGLKSPSAVANPDERPGSSLRSEFSTDTTLVEGDPGLNDSGGKSSPGLGKLNGAIPRRLDRKKRKDGMTPSVQTKEGGRFRDETTMKAGIVLALVSWLQGGLTVWDMFAAMLGFVTLSDPSKRPNSSPCENEQERKKGNRRLEYTAWKMEGRNEDSDTESPVGVAPSWTATRRWGDEDWVR